MIHNYTLTADLLLNFTGKDYISPLARFNKPMEVLMYIFACVSPVSLILNTFVFSSCMAILLKKSSDRPSLVFIAYNSVLDLFTTIVEVLVITSAVNPSIANIESLPKEPDTYELTHRCQIEKALVSFTVFSSLTSVLLLTTDRFIFITQPLTYSNYVTIPRAWALVVISIILSTAASVGYSMCVELPWDKVCTFTHVLPIGLVIFWNSLFFCTWTSMHFMYGVILVIALKHKRAINKNRVSSPTISDPSSSGMAANTSSSNSSETKGFQSRKNSQLRMSSSTSSLLKDKNQLTTTFKTIRYIVILLFVFSLVELPCVTVAVDDLFTHAIYNNELTDQYTLPVDDVTPISLLHCTEKFILNYEAKCTFYTESNDFFTLPWSTMMNQMSHSLHLTRVFTISLLGWTVNAMADPIVYAFWYPVFRKHMLKICCNIKTRKKGSSSSFRVTPLGPNNAIAQDNNNVSKFKSNHDGEMEEVGKDNQQMRIFVVGEESHL